jgi:endonuclease/exonuclease/phosphatase family metal-dependent hydrolase
MKKCSINLTQKTILTLLITTTFFLTGLVISPTSNAALDLDPGLVQTVQTKVSIMAFNLENLFDTKHDENKNDYTYLPLSEKRSKEHEDYCDKNFTGGFLDECLSLDWSEKVLAEKKKRLADVILQVNNGMGPDILMTEETENIGVLTALSKDNLAKANYQTVVLLEGPDNRGIDTGLLSRFPLVGTPILHIIPFKTNNSEDANAAKTTRGVLQVDLKLPDGQTLTVLGVHLPSQAHPTYLRQQALAYLTELKNSLPADRLVITGGDFNITSKEDATTGMVKTDFASSWLVSHIVGCHSCQGSYYFFPERSWSFFDIFAFSQNFASTNKGSWHLNPDSIMLPHASKYQADPLKQNPHFNPKLPTTVSDHYPIYAEIELNP